MHRKKKERKMNIIDDTFYVGFEGEPEIIFIYQKNNNEYKLVIWEGYFDEIMKNILPDKHGWTSLAYYYNLHIGWYEEDVWKIKDLKKAYIQLKSAKISAVGEETKIIIQKICSILFEAMYNGFDVYIARE